MGGERPDAVMSMDGEHAGQEQAAVVNSTVVGWSGKDASEVPAAASHR
mgnify:CR=1 FL=1